MRRGRAARRRGTLRAAVRGGAAVRSAPPAGAPLRRPARGAVRCARAEGWGACAEGWGGARRGTVRRALSTSRSVLHTDHLRAPPSYCWGFNGKPYSIDALSPTARSSFDSFDASCL